MTVQAGIDEWNGVKSPVERAVSPDHISTHAHSAGGIERMLKAKKPNLANPRKPKMLVFGDAGVGKTWGALGFPTPYYIDAEGGATQAHYAQRLDEVGGAYLGPDEGANDYDVVTDEMRQLATVKHPYRTFIVDSHTKMFNSQIALDYQRMENAGSDMNKTFSAEKKGAINWMRKWLLCFEKMDMTCILICHSKTKWADGKEAGFTFDGWDKLAYELDLVVHVVKQGAARKARIIKSRLKEFSEGATIDWSYDSFASLYGGAVLEAEAHPVEPATDDQILDYTGMLDVMKVDAKILEKWGEVEVSDLTREQMQKRIDYLNSLKGKK